MRLTLVIAGISAVLLAAAPAGAQEPAAQPTPAATSEPQLDDSAAGDAYVEAAPAPQRPAPTAT
ncbi:MAG: hypothetical protein M3O90_03735, partial [Actinomycetota bacterium]|nr:hypothetical protein [Actinomycetota bacterium]